MNLISNPTSLRQLRIEVKQRNPWLICYLLGIKLFRKVLGWTTFLNWRPLNFVFSLYPVGMWTEDRWWNFSGGGHSRQPTPPTPLPPSGVANPHQEVRPQSPHHLSRPLVILQTPPTGIKNIFLRPLSLEKTLCLSCTNLLVKLTSAVKLPDLRFSQREVFRLQFLEKTLCWVWVVLTC